MIAHPATIATMLFHLLALPLFIDIAGPGILARAAKRMHIFRQSAASRHSAR